MENQYRVGDVVEIEGAIGTVERISIRSTVVRDSDGNVHFLPNGSVVHVINKTMGYSRVNLTLGVVPDTNIDQLSEIIDEVGAALSQRRKVEGQDPRTATLPLYRCIFRCLSRGKGHCQDSAKRTMGSHW